MYLNIKIHRVLIFGAVTAMIDCVTNFMQTGIAVSAPDQTHEVKAGIGIEQACAENCRRCDRACYENYPEHNPFDLEHFYPVMMVNTMTPMTAAMMMTENMMEQQHKPINTSMQVC